MIIPAPVVLKSEELPVENSRVSSTTTSSVTTNVPTGTPYEIPDDSTGDDLESCASDSCCSIIDNDESDYNPTIDLDDDGDASDVELEDDDKGQPGNGTETGGSNPVSTSAPRQKRKLYVQQYNQNPKRHSCLYCKKHLIKMARHLEQRHSDEYDVAKALRLAVKSKERKIAWSALVNKGDYNHNYSVIDKGSGCIIPKYRLKPSRSSDVDKYLPCEYCFAMYRKKDMWKHHGSCPQRKTARDKSKRGEPIKNGKLLMPPKVEPSDLPASGLDDEELKDIVQTDPLVIAYGVRLYEKHGHEIHNRSYVNSKLRELARLILSIRKTTEFNRDLECCIDPANWESLIDGVKDVAGYDRTNHSYKIPSLPLKLGASLFRCAKVLHATGLVVGNDEKINKAQRLMDLYVLEWSDRITLRERQSDEPCLLTLIGDVVKLQQFLAKTTEQKTNQMATNIKCYIDLVQLTIAQVSLFNGKRTLEVEQMKLSDYETVIQSQVETSKQVEDSLSKFEVHLCDSHSRIEIAGERGTPVAVLLTQGMLVAIEALVASRELAGVKSDLLFAGLRDVASPYSGRDCLWKYAEESGANQPDLVTSSNVSKQVTTMCQVVSLGDNSHPIISEFLDRDIRFHRSFSRLPDDLPVVAKVTKAIHAINRGDISKWRGRDFEEIEFDPEGEFIVFIGCDCFC